MTRLYLALTTILASAAGTSPAVDRVAPWTPFIAEAASRFDLPAAWLIRVMRAESGGMTTVRGAPIRSRAGAMGLMQLMPSTWNDMRTRQALGARPDDPHDNIIAGAAYLRMMVDRFGYPGAIAAYNAGPERYAAFFEHRAKLPAETIAYLASVTGTARSPSITAATPPGQLLFALRHDLPTARPLSTDRPIDTGLFAVRTVVP